MERRVQDMRRDFCFEGVALKNLVNAGEEEKRAVLGWRNSTEVSRWLYSAHAISWEEHTGFIEGLKKDSRNFYWLVALEGGQRLGVVSLNRVDAANGNAYLGLYANPSRTGAGRTLMGCIKRLAFEEAGLHTLKLEVIESNERALRFYAKAGFTEEGRLREFVSKEGRRMDVIIMGIVKEEGTNGV
ncbi:MAG: UDP-4-amino-4,6-dideoxy-N-acetyl-beta-L-altrosamine N-acetyltransferase [Thermodesulfobacteriota bacterium]